MAKNKSNVFLGILFFLDSPGRGRISDLYKKDSRRNRIGSAKHPPTSGETGTGAPAAAEAGAEPAPLQVKAVTASRGDLVMTLKSPGEAYTERKTSPKSEVGGTIKNLACPGRSAGSWITSPFVEIDDTDYRLNLEKLEAMRLKYLSELHLEKQFAVADEEATPEALANVDKTQTAYESALAGFQAGKVAAPDLEKAQRDYELALIDAGRKKDEIIATTKGLTGAEIDVKAGPENPGENR